jgi:hypothetical protein
VEWARKNLREFDHIWLSAPLRLGIAKGDHFLTEIFSIYGDYYYFVLSLTEKELLNLYCVE